MEGGDVAKAAGMLERALEPFRMVVGGGSYLLRGALDLAASLGVSDHVSSGGVI